MINIRQFLAMTMMWDEEITDHETCTMTPLQIIYWKYPNYNHQINEIFHGIDFRTHNLELFIFLDKFIVENDEFACYQSTDTNSLYRYTEFHKKQFEIVFETYDKRFSKIVSSPTLIYHQYGRDVHEVIV